MRNTNLRNWIGLIGSGGNAEAAKRARFAQTRVTLPKGDIFLLLKSNTLNPHPPYTGNPYVFRNVLNKKIPEHIKRPGILYSVPFGSSITQISDQGQDLLTRALTR